MCALDISNTESYVASSFVDWVSWSEAVGDRWGEWRPRGRRCSRGREAEGTASRSCRWEEQFVQMKRNGTGDDGSAGLHGAPATEFPTSISMPASRKRRMKRRVPHSERSSNVAGCCGIASLCALHHFQVYGNTLQFLWT